MRENEAAAYLKINTRTLYRYRKSGKLAYREVAGKARPYIDYDQIALDELKHELDERRTSKPKPKESPRPTSRRVTFGMPLEGYEELSIEAAKYQMTAGEYARRLVREGLESRFHAETTELHDQMKRLKDDMNAVRTNFAAAFESVLEFVGLSPDDAKRWVEDNLR